MKVNRISFSGKSNTNNLQNPNHTATINPFFYVKNPENRKEDFRGTSFRILTAGLALLAVGVTLLNLKGRKMLSEGIVDLAGESTGFNRLKKHQKTISELKLKILYPLKCSLMGDKIPANSRDFKSGFILSSNNAEEVKDFMAAFTEHSKNLDIHCLNMPQDLKRNEKSKWAHKAMKIAKENYAKSTKHTIINLGDISALTEMQNKPTKSRIENLLSAVDSEKYQGVVWTAWTDKPRQIPYFYNNLPILITKLLD